MLEVLLKSILKISCDYDGNLKIRIVAFGVGIGITRDC